MPDTIAPHIGWIKEWWHVVTGIVLAVVWAVVRLLRTVFITHTQMKDYSNDNKIAHARIETKLESKFDRIISILLEKRDG